MIYLNLICLQNFEYNLVKIVLKYIKLRLLPLYLNFKLIKIILIQKVTIITIISLFSTLNIKY